MLNLGRNILDINLHNRYEQEFFRCGEGLKLQNFLRTSFVHVLLSCRRRNIHLLNLRDDRGVGSALFFEGSFKRLSISPLLFVQILRLASRYNAECDTITFCNDMALSRHQMETGAFGSLSHAIFNFCYSLKHLSVTDTELALLSAICLISGGGHKS